MKQGPSQVFRIRCQAGFRLKYGTTSLAEGKAITLSADDITFSGRAEFPVGTELDLEFQIGELKLRTKAAVERCHSGTMAARFLGLAVGDRLRMLQWIVTQPIIENAKTGRAGQL